jgi:SAM-dependent methyltransferase
LADGKGTERTAAAKPPRCPICCASAGFSRRRPRIAGGHIFVCAECSGYFLFPPTAVVYEESGWTAMRRREWRRDRSRGEQYAAAIAEWYARWSGDNLRSVLEIGCGTGYMGVGFEVLGVRYSGIDVDAASVSFARSQGLEVEELPVEALSASALASRSFDLVLSSNVLEHVDGPMCAFQEIRRATRRLAVIVVPNPEGLLPRLKANRAFLRVAQRFWGHDRVIAYSIDGFWHNIAYSRRTLAYLAAHASLDVKSLRSIGINDPVFGFVQPNASLLYRGVAALGRMLDMDSQLLLVAE